MSTKNNLFPVSHSLLSTHALLKLIKDNYKLEEEQKNCFLITSRLNDTYLITTRSDKKYILRVYRHNWRKEHDIMTEIELLLFLKSNNFPVSIPIPTVKDNYVLPVNVAEGERFIVLYDCIEGTAPSLDIDISYQYGQNLAQLHKLTLQWQSQYPRFQLDEDHLLNVPFKYIKSYFTDKQLELELLNETIQELNKFLIKLPKTSLNYGMCHGDHFGNSFIDAAGKQIFFDFDCSGMSWRMYDIAQFLWAIKMKFGVWTEQYLAPDEELWQSFLKGYQSILTISNQDFYNLPHFSIIRTIWGMGLQPANIEHLGISWIEEVFNRSFSYICSILQNNTHIFQVDLNSYQNKNWISKYANDLYTIT